MKKLGFIDPFMKTPAVHCFNEFIDLMATPTSYHMPSQFGVRSLEDHQSDTDGYIIVGSASHVTEPLAWHAPLAKFLLAELKRGKPVFGCCFGHQLICHALGSSVEFAHPLQEKSSGVRNITFNQDFRNYKRGENFHLAVTHRQIVTTLGPGLIEVGRGLLNDIVAHKDLPLLCTQAHPEASSFFCTSDIQNMTLNEEQQSRKNGSDLIKRFFNSF